MAIPNYQTGYGQVKNNQKLQARGSEKDDADTHTISGLLMEINLVYHLLYWLSLTGKSRTISVSLSIRREITFFLQFITPSHHKTLDRTDTQNALTMIQHK